MLRVRKPEIISTPTGARIQAKFDNNGMEDVLWYEVEDKYKEYLSEDRADGFVIGLLLYAMQIGSDIEVLSPMSTRLYYTVNKYLIPLLSQVNGYKNIKMYCKELISTPLETKGVVGTGLSCGIDSFSTIIDHAGDRCPEIYQITHFTFFNVGSNGHDKYKSSALFRERAAKAKKAADELGKELITVDSNLSEILKLGFEATHTLRSMSAVLILQNLFSVYYYSSAVHVANFKLSQSSIAYYDIYSLSMLSTESIDLFSSCATKTRIEKTRMVANFKPSYKYLDVCVKDNANCSKCFKCLRTLFTLELLGKLDLYSSVFDLRAYYSERNKYIAYILAFHKKDIFSKEIYNEMKNQNFRTPLYSKMVAIKFKTNAQFKTLFMGKGIYTKLKMVFEAANSKMRLSELMNRK